jgi:hypothetical protein
MIELVYKECKANNVIVYGSVGTGADRTPCEGEVGRSGDDDDGRRRCVIPRSK